MDHVSVASPMGYPRQESILSISDMVHLRLLMCGPHAKDMPVHLACHLKGGMGPKKCGLRCGGGLVFFSSAEGGPWMSESVSLSKVRVGDKCTKQLRSLGRKTPRPDPKFPHRCTWSELGWCIVHGFG